MSRAVARFFFGLAVLSVLANIFLFRSSRLAKDDRDSYRDISRAETKRAIYWENKAGQSQARMEVAEASSAIIRETYGDDIKNLQKVISGLKKDISNLHSLTSVSLKTQGEVKTVLRDTVINTGQFFDSAKTFSHHDRWASIDGYFLRDSARLTYSFYDSLSVVSYFRRPMFFKPKQLFVDVISHNPHSKITNLKSIAVRTPRRSRFVLGPFVGIDYNLKPTLGFGLTYRLIEF